jgi:hypothetical protein
MEVLTARSASPGECTVIRGDVTYRWLLESIEHPFGEDVVVWRRRTDGYPGGTWTEYVAVFRFGDLISGVSLSDSVRGFDSDPGFLDELQIEKLEPIVDAARDRVAALAD